MLDRQTSEAELAAFKLYLGVALRETDELVQARLEICSRLGLVPRTEAHVTIAYVGQLTESELARLVGELTPCVDDGLASFQLTGTGAAWEAEPGAAQLLCRENFSDAQPHACVAWWSVEPSPAITRLRNAASRVLEQLGRPLSTSEPYCPHVTLGSRGNAEIADEDFDVFSLEKGATLREFSAPSRVLAARAHLTASKLLPASVVCLRAW
jgi:2'-5' RNA ligase